MSRPRHAASFTHPAFTHPAVRSAGLRLTHAFAAPLAVASLSLGLAITLTMVSVRLLSAIAA